MYYKHKTFIYKYSLKYGCYINTMYYNIYMFYYYIPISKIYII